MKTLALGIITILVLALLVVGGVRFYSRESATVPIEEGYGPNPTLPPPNPKPIPTVNVAPVDPWPEGATPKAAPGLKVNAFAKDLDHPRWLHVLPNGDVLVAETNNPVMDNPGFSFRGWITSLVMKQAGAKTTSANRITLLRDSDHDGVAEIREAFLEGLNSPFGMTLSNGFMWPTQTQSSLFLMRMAIQRSRHLPKRSLTCHVGRSTITGRRMLLPALTDRNFMQQSGQTAMWAKMALMRKRTGQEFLKLISRREICASSPQVCAIQMAYHGIPPVVSYGWR